MPIEIKELHIRINVDSEHEGVAKQQVQGQQSQRLVQQCVEQVMELLNHRHNER